MREIAKLIAPKHTYSPNFTITSYSHTHPHEKTQHSYTLQKCEFYLILIIVYYVDEMRLRLHATLNKRQL